MAMLLIPDTAEGKFLRPIKEGRGFLCLRSDRYNYIHIGNPVAR